MGLNHFSAQNFGAQHFEADHFRQGGVVVDIRHPSGGGSAVSSKLRRNKIAAVQQLYDLEQVIESVVKTSAQPSVMHEHLTEALLLLESFTRAQLSIKAGLIRALKQVQRGEQLTEQVARLRDYSKKLEAELKRRMREDDLAVQLLLDI